jgi:ABC-type multidrug transport system fused ATPase/permease subunit
MSFFEVLWAMLIFFMWIVWIWLLITVFIDIFRDKSQSGWAKALWVLFLIFLPLLGVLVYLIARGDSMHERQYEHAAKMEQAQRKYIQNVAAPASTAGELEKLAALHKDGVLSDDEFAAQKAKLLS